MAVLKVIEVMASSENSWEEAAQNAVKQAAKSVKNIRSAYVREQSLQVRNDAITEYRVNVKISFEIE